MAHWNAVDDSREEPLGREKEQIEEFVLESLLSWKKF